MSEKPIVLITGASQGIGRAAALLMARAGWHVIAVARSQKALEALDDEIIKITGENATIVPLDIKDGNGIDRLGYSIFERYKKLDGLIHCAAKLGDLMPLEHNTPREAQNIIDINITALFRIICSFSPLLGAAPNGRAIFMTSSVAKDPRPYWSLYSASKAAMENMVQSWAAEQTSTNIVASLLNPGATATGMRAKIFPGEDPKTLPAPEDLGTIILELLDFNRPKELSGQIINFRDTEHFRAWQAKKFN